MEAYDLLRDSKGYLWIGHDMGVSRYDGSAFINFHNPQQSSLSVSNLVEDKQGRIWCHNFSGQIFYIENLQMHLLQEYKYEEEQGFPRIAICGEELIASSVKGVFVYNLLTAKSKYYPIPKGTNSLTCIGKKVILFGTSGWYCYEKGKPLSKLKTNWSIPNYQTCVLENVCFKDTFYFMANPMGAYYKLTLENDEIKMHSENRTAAFINTISLHNNKVWINTKEFSYTTDGKEFIKRVNLSDVVTDQQGHRWMSSLKNGLCVQYNQQQIKSFADSIFKTGNDVRTVRAAGNAVFFGTVSGNLYRQKSSSSLEYILSTPKQDGAIERIASIDNNRLLLAGSVGLYCYNFQTKSLKKLPIFVTVKDIVARDGKIYLATTTGIKVISFQELQNSWSTPEPEELFDKETRCRSIAFSHDSLIAVYNDGVYILHKNTIRPLLYNRLPIYASQVRNIDGKIVIGTFNQGLLILDNGTLTAINEKNGLASNTIKEIRTTAGITWLVYTDRFQKLNASLTGVEDVAFPFSRISTITDLAVLDNWLYVVTGEAVYSLMMKKALSGIHTTTYVDKVIVNGKDLTAGKPLRYNQNFLQFQVSTPFFSPYTALTYQYRIKNAPDNSWQRGIPGQSVFNLIALEPGVYDFEVVATDESRNIISAPATYRFEIEPPWYQHWLFKLSLALTVAALGLYFVRLYYLSRLRKQRTEYEKMLAVETERQRISSEIHDDIGAGLSAVRLLTELTKNKLPENETKQEVGKIHNSLGELSHKMREVIWSLNTDNDYLENLLYYIRRQALLLFENSPIHLRVSFPADQIPEITIKGEKRRHIYLAVKEALHNCLKHSEAANCHLCMQLHKDALLITVADDGKGFAATVKEKAGNGLTGMKKRMQQIDGSFIVESVEKTVVKLVIPLNEKHA